MRSRRSFLAQSPIALAAALAACNDDKKRPDVGAIEDLMREHAVLDRILIVYEEGARRLDAAETGWAVDAIGQAARVVRKFIEDYHEKAEEEIIFARLLKAQKLGDVVATLKAQHLVGRPLTDRIESAAIAPTLVNADIRRALVRDLRGYVRMYRPHEAREETVVYPAFKTLVGVKELDEIGEQMEDREQKALGQGGFEKILVEVSAIERTLGVDDLAKFTAS
jgi:hemerythrin-like domain-containing protein